MAINHMFSPPARYFQNIKWRQSVKAQEIFDIIGAIYCSGLVRGILEGLLPVKQVYYLPRAETEVSHSAGEMAILPKGMSHSFPMRTSDSNIKVEYNSNITASPQR